MNPFNPSQSRSIAIGFQGIHRRLADIEAMLDRAGSESPFSEYVPDLSPTEVQVLRDYFARIRAALLDLLRDCDIPLGVHRTSLRWGAQTHLGMVAVTVAELGPRQLEGYGPLSEDGRDRAVRLRQELDRLVERAHAFLARKNGPELSARLTRLGGTGGADDLRLIDRVVTRWGLVEFRPQLDALARRLEAPEFEIAVFGRVSSGKSSLLNHVAGADVLPVGVTPVTAVPTRLTRGDEPKCVVSFAESSPRTVPVGELKEYASEEGNPGNYKHVTDILVRVPSGRLPNGVVLVDTPGVGSLARAGAAETMAYLPRCDLGVVLVDAASTLNADDLTLLHALADAGTPAQVLVSKADLLTPADREKSVAYVAGQLRRELGAAVPVHAVSTVGVDAALLTGWFEGALAPLLARHRELAGQSLRRKVAILRESVGAVLKTMTRRPSTSNGVPAEAVAQARALLEEADRAVQTFQGRVRSWAGSPEPLVEQIVRETAGRNRPGGAASISETARAALVERGRRALDLARGLQDVLGRTLAGLAATRLVAGVDAGAVARAALRGLPDVDLGLFAEVRGERPWWGAIPGLTVHSLRVRFGDSLQAIIDGYDHNIQLWLTTVMQHLTEAFESQAEVVREQVRRMASEPAGTTGEVSSELEHDVQTLLGDEQSPAVARESALPGAAPAAAK